MKVTAVLVSHNGARWLPKILTGLGESTTPPDAIIAVDTGSTDDSVAMITDHLGTDVRILSPQTPYGTAVATALAQLPPAEPDEWVWLLQDDCAPAPDCLATLRDAATTAPADVVALGPKLREWPSLRRLLEVGVTITGTGRRETGLEPGEYDQGQHDADETVLAVNTAAMLIRRDVLDTFGIDPDLAVLGGDVDLGWRIARAGLRTRVVPAATAFHAEASRQGLRDAALVVHPRRESRTANQFILLANSPLWSLPFRYARMLFGGLLRAVGLVLVRAPAEALDEVVAILTVLGNPVRIARARRRRSAQRRVSHAAVRPLLAPFWLPYRHGIDYIVDVGAAVMASTRSQAARRRPGAADTALLPALLRTPAAWGLLAVIVVTLVSLRVLDGDGPVHGGALAPVPDGVGHWWAGWGARQHLVGTGSTAPGPPYLLPLALAGTLAFGSATAVITALLFACVPLAYLGAWRLVRRFTHGRWVPVWAGASYALLPVVGGALGQGRLGTIVGAMVLPWVVGSAQFLAELDPQVRWRAAWRTALGAALLVAFVPPAFPLILMLVLGAMVGVPRFGLREAAVVVLAPLATLAPWLAGTFTRPHVWLLEAGRVLRPEEPGGPADLLLGRAGGFAAPAWVSAGIIIVGLAAWLRPQSRPLVARAWAVAAVAALLALLTALVPVVLPGLPDPVPAWSGFALLVVYAAWIFAGAVAADGAARDLADRSFGWRQPVAALAVVGGLLLPLAGAGWWLSGPATPIGRSHPRAVPAYMSDLAVGTDTNAVLRLRGRRQAGFDYQVFRHGVPRTGDAEILALTPPDPEFADLVERLLSAAEPADTELLAAYGVKYIFAPRPVSGLLSGALDSTPGISGASAPAPGTRAWVVQPETTLTAGAITATITAPSVLARPWLAAGALLAMVAIIVLAAPDRRRPR